MADPTVQVAIVSGIAGVVSTMGVIAVAFINNRKERGGAAEKGVEITLRERIVLRDEQIVDLKADIARRDATIEERDEALAAAMQEILKLKEPTKGKRT